MTFLAPLAAVVSAALLATGPLTQQPRTPGQQQSASKPAVVSLIGCVERVAATPAVPGSTQPASQRPAYKLIDIQPGAGTTLTMKADSQFLLTVSTSLATPLDLGKFQNQRVEATGTISPAPEETVKPQPVTRPAGQTPAAPLQVFTATSVKVISTECK